MQIVGELETDPDAPSASLPAPVVVPVKVLATPFKVKAHLLGYDACPSRSRFRTT